MLRLVDTDVIIDRPFMSTAPRLNQAFAATVTSFKIVMVRAVVARSSSLTFVPAQFMARFCPKGMYRVLIFLMTSHILPKAKMTQDKKYNTM